MCKFSIRIVLTAVVVVQHWVQVAMSFSFRIIAVMRNSWVTRTLMNYLSAVVGGGGSVKKTTFFRAWKLINRISHWRELTACRTGQQRYIDNIIPVSYITLLYVNLTNMNVRASSYVKSFAPLLREWYNEYSNTRSCVPTIALGKVGNKKKGIIMLK